MSGARRQRGFTLIEVMVAFSIFALCIGTLLGVISDSTRRSVQSQNREQALLVAKSVLSQLRATPEAWESPRTGESNASIRWSTTVVPYGRALSQGRESWQAYQVTIVARGPQGRAVELASIELARSTP